MPRNMAHHVVCKPAVGAAFLKNICRLVLCSLAFALGACNPTTARDDAATNSSKEYSALGENDLCRLAPDAGPCEGHFIRYYFDQDTAACTAFGWGGCQGAAPFDTLQACKQTCETGADHAASISLDEPFTLKVGQSARYGADLVVTFVKVIGDSRCPADVICVWAGEATVLVHVAKEGAVPESFELTLTVLNQDTSIAVFEEYSLKFEYLHPYPVHESDGVVKEQIATFRLTKTSE